MPKASCRSRSRSSSSSFQPTSGWKGVVYCYTLVNTGEVTLTYHTLMNDKLGLLLDNTAQEVAPGASFSTTVTQTLTVSVTNVDLRRDLLAT